MKHKKAKRFFLFAGIISIFIFLTAMKFDSTKKLRSQPKLLYEYEVDQMINRLGFHDKYNNVHGDFDNKFEAATINGDKVIKDLASGLMWMAISSGEFTRSGNTGSWINESNTKKYAGYADWRLPTLEEAMTLVESKKNANGQFLDPLFANIPAFWTSDRLKSSKNKAYSRITETWLVKLTGGYCTRVDEMYEDGHVLAVRSLSAKKTLPNKDGKFRCQSKTLSLDEVKNLLKKNEFYDSNFNPSASGFKNDFKLIDMGSHIFINDNAAGLMWMPVAMPVLFGRNSKGILDNLNQTGKIGGFRDWRMPTLEEAMSIMENTRNKKGKHLNAWFSGDFTAILTCDLKENDVWNKTWAVDYANGTCNKSGGGKLLLVRSLGN